MPSLSAFQFVPLASDPSFHLSLYSLRRLVEFLSTAENRSQAKLMSAASILGRISWADRQTQHIDCRQETTEESDAPPSAIGDLLRGFWYVSKRLVEFLCNRVGTCHRVVLDWYRYHIPGRFSYSVG